MASDPEAAAIAARLTPAQKRALLAMPERDVFRPDSGRHAITLDVLDQYDLVGFARYELAHPAWSGQRWQALSLGLRVRAVIAAEAAG